MMKAKNVLGLPLEDCSRQPMTGYFRDGCCNTDENDYGLHLVCAQVTQAFLYYSLDQGNDLITPVPDYDFPGLKPGDRWCVCAERWKQALDDGVAPPVVLAATHEKTLQIVDLATLLVYAIDAPKNTK